jgi:translation initiation factor 1
MSAKFKGTKLVYSTNPDINDWDESEKEEINLKPEEQQLYISLDKKQRRGKKVTLVTGFLGSNNDLKELGKILKSKCGVGGSAKDDQIIIQGEFKEKIVKILTDLGYKCKLIGG